MDLARMGITRRWTRAHTAQPAADDAGTEDEDTEDETVTGNEMETR